jgi:hypothetical protein
MAMTLWKNCRADIYYTDESDLNDPGYEVRITDDEMVISYEGDSGWVNYAGKDLGGGHYALISPEVKGRAMMHRAPESEIIEGNWSEEGCHGMWRLHLIA